MARAPVRRLLVEGEEDKRVIPELKEHILDGRAPAGKRFVDWFRRLYGV